MVRGSVSDGSNPPKDSGRSVSLFFIHPIDKEEAEERDTQVDRTLYNPRA